MSEVTTITLPGGFVYTFGGPEVPADLIARISAAPRRRVGRGWSVTIEVTAADLRAIRDYTDGPMERGFDPDFVRTAPVVYERATDALYALTGSL